MDCYRGVTVWTNLFGVKRNPEVFWSSPTVSLNLIKKKIIRCQSRARLKLNGIKIGPYPQLLPQTNKFSMQSNVNLLWRRVNHYFGDNFITDYLFHYLNLKNVFGFCVITDVQDMLQVTLTLSGEYYQLSIWLEWERNLKIVS